MKYFEEKIDISSGIGKFIHILTWPIRKFYIIIPIITLICVLPIFFDIKPNKVHVWYKDKAVELYDEVVSKEFVSNSINKIKSLLGFDTQESFTPKKGEEANVQRGIDTLVDMPKARARNFKRKGFDAAGGDVQIPKFQVEIDSSNSDEVIIIRNDGYENEDYDYAPTYGSLKKTLENEVVRNNVKDDIVVASNVRNIVSKPVAKKLPLIYLQTPKNILGKAKIINSNELKIGEVHILLYGIYVAPNSSQGMKAKAYLENKTRNRDVKCSIVAYTHQNIATAICFVDKENLNRELVDRDLTNNVAL